MELRLATTCAVLSETAPPGTWQIHTSQSSDPWEYTRCTVSVNGTRRSGSAPYGSPTAPTGPGMVASAAARATATTQYRDQRRRERRNGDIGDTVDG